jgi:glycosyltransferase involved in cell wall biosynthesis
MRDRGLLFIGGTDMMHLLNHASTHMATYFAQRFGRTDLVGFDKFYSGTGPATAPPWYKARKGISNLLHSRISKSEHGSGCRIIVRDLFAPLPVQFLVRGAWRYVNVCQAIAPPYELAIFGNAENAYLAWLLKHSGRVRRLIYYDWDYYPGLYCGVFTAPLMEWYERLCVREADAVLSVNGLLARRRRQQGAKRVLVVPNGADLSLFAQARQKVAHQPTLVYIGSLSPLWGVDLAIRAMPALSNSIANIRLLIAGVGPEEADLRVLSQALGVAESVSFLGHVEYQALPSVLAEADVGIATSSPSSAFRRYASPLKLIEYMAAGLPIIATRLGQTEITIQQADSGILIDHSVEEFVAAAASLLSDRPLYERHSQAGIEYATGFDWDLLMDKAYRYVVDVIEDDPKSCIVRPHSEGPPDAS